MLTWNRIAGWLVLALLTTGLIVGCGRATRDDLKDSYTADTSIESLASDCRVIEHDLGETEVCGQPQKVVTINAYALDLLLSLGVQPAGSTITLNVHQGEIFDNPAQQIPYLGDRVTTQPMNLGNASEPSLEKLTLLKPDLIVGQAGRVDNYDLLSQIAPTLLWRNRTAKGQWQESLRDLAIALEQSEKAEAMIQQYETRIVDARADLANVVATYPKLLLLGASRLDEGVFAINADSYLGELLESIGFQLISPSVAKANAPISIEALPELDDADSIIILGYNFDVSDGRLENPASSADTTMGDLLETHQVQPIQQDWQESAIAQSLTASQENRVYFATFYKWNGLNGPIGAELILEQLRQFLLEG
ncbi:MAG: iron-siderophore ABC transporter substrate-binding protein [Cyanobacteria bacterium P01_H01_bin.21]